MVKNWRDHTALYVPKKKSSWQWQRIGSFYIFSDCCVSVRVLYFSSGFQITCEFKLALCEAKRLSPAELARDLREQNQPFFEKADCLKQGLKSGNAKTPRGQSGSAPRFGRRKSPQFGRRKTTQIGHRIRYHSSMYQAWHTYIKTYIPTYLHTYIDTYIPAYLYTYKPTYLHTYIHTYIWHSYIHTCIH